MEKSTPFQAGAVALSLRLPSPLLEEVDRGCVGLKACWTTPSSPGERAGRGTTFGRLYCCVCPEW